MRGVPRAGLGLRRAVRVTLLADTVSIAVVGVVALAVAFVVTPTVTRAMMPRGRGRVVVRELH